MTTPEAVQILEELKETRAELRALQSKPLTVDSKGAYALIGIDTKSPAAAIKAFRTFRIANDIKPIPGMSRMYSVRKIEQAINGK